MITVPVWVRERIFTFVLRAERFTGGLLAPTRRKFTSCSSISLHHVLRAFSVALTCSLSECGCAAAFVRRVHDPNQFPNRVAPKSTDQQKSARPHETDRMCTSPAAVANHTANASVHESPPSWVRKTIETASSTVRNAKSADRVSLFR